MIDRVLVPLDGSALAEQALPHALAVARAFGGEVILLRVLGSQVAPVNGAEFRLRKAEAAGYLSAVAARIGGSGTAVSHAVLVGNAPEQILAAVRDRRADLLVICRHGAGGATDFHLSGTASKLVASATCSLLVVDPDGPAAIPDVTGPASYGRMVVPVDCSKRSEWGVCLAASLARAAGAELVLVHVASPPEVVEPASGDARAAQLARELGQINVAAARSYLEALAPRLSPPAPRVRHRIVENGHVGPTLLRVAAEEAASLVVLSAHGHAPALGAAYGSVASALVADCTAPVLIFQDAPAPVRFSAPAGGEARAAR
jgi:nucleotide-binding universal stress UspA family protein